MPWRYALLVLALACVATASENSKKLLDKGVAALRQGDTQTSTLCFQKLVESQPRNGHYHFLLGATHLKAQRASHAWVAFRKAVRLDPPFQLARLVLVMGQVEHAAMAHHDVEVELPAEPLPEPQRMVAAAADWSGWVGGGRA